MQLLVTGAWPGAKEHIPSLEAMGHTVYFLQQEKDPLPCDPSRIEGVICNGLFLHHPLEAFPNLRYIQLTSAGFDRVPLEEIKRRNIIIHNARGVYSAPMAEFALAGVLQLYKKAAFFRSAQQARAWEKRRDLKELGGQTVCILGCGSVGTECARRFAAFDCRVIGVNRTVKPFPFFETVYGLEELRQALQQADIVVVTLPLNGQTYHLLNSDTLRAIKDGAVLVNLARGALVDTAALLQHLDRLSGAVLDVFEEEPLSKDSPLWDRENVLLTPHNSFVGDGNGMRLSKVILDNLKEF